MSQTRFYVAESRVLAPRVSLFVGGLPPGRSPQEYSSLLDKAVASKGATAWAGPGAWPGGGQGGRPEGGCAGWAAWSPGCVPLLPRAPQALAEPLPSWFLAQRVSVLTSGAQPPSPPLEWGGRFLGELRCWVV